MSTANAIGFPLIIHWTQLQLTSLYVWLLFMDSSLERSSIYVCKWEGERQFYLLTSCPICSSICTSFAICSFPTLKDTHTHSVDLALDVHTRQTLAPNWIPGSHSNPIANKEDEKVAGTRRIRRRIGGRQETDIIISKPLSMSLILTLGESLALIALIARRSLALRESQPWNFNDW